LVSILVLVDFSLKLEKREGKQEREESFNPCFGGFFSKTMELEQRGIDRNGFNPCFGGFFSKTLKSEGRRSKWQMFQSLFWWIFL